MEYLIIWILFGIGSAMIATGKEKSGGLWFVLGMLLGPFGLLFALLARDERTAAADSLRKCPSCAEMIQREAVKCRFCQIDVEPQPEPQLEIPASLIAEPKLSPEEAEEKKRLRKHNRRVVLAFAAVAVLGVVLLRSANEDRAEPPNWVSASPPGYDEMGNLIRPAIESVAPSSPKPTSQPALEAALKGSDGFSIYRTVFLKASSKLVEKGTCAISDFKEMGGWVKSTSHKTKPIYFTYCGEMTVQNRIYLDVSTGRTFK